MVPVQIVEDGLILSSQEPTEVQISKVKLKLCRKNQKCILVIALNPKILYMSFLTAQLNRIDEKIKKT